jgi:hypothetical protein
LALFSIFSFTVERNSPNIEARSLHSVFLSGDVQLCTIEGEPGGSEGAEANSFNAVHGAWPRADNFPGVR